MKKIKLIAFFLIAICVTVNAQDTTTVYLNKNWKKVKPAKALYMQNEIKLNSNSIKTELYNLDGKLLSSGYFVDDYMDSIWCIYNTGNDQYDTLNYSGIKEMYFDNNPKSQFEDVFFIVKEMPVFGDTSTKEEMQGKIRQYIDTHMHYPIRAKQSKTQGKVYISFIIGPDGKIYKPTVALKVDKDLDFEALRLARDFPDWKPGKHRDMNVAVSHTMPVTFELK
ncbi:TonB family protein [Maribellus sp. CM-23]|uniref:TonB family protein n=1 Tax=Maribellus sp. CM-23 TaxID=2781026 RepID=UPI001F3F270E|nr:TonB family protein [Maribellus sp. CM-23]MCE4566589.1 TonB family protein [Maribellus sp. CM-23]